MGPCQSATCPFKGIEGTIKRIHNNRHLVIALPHIGVLAITISRTTDLELLPQK